MAVRDIARGDLDAVVRRGPAKATTRPGPAKAGHYVRRTLCRSSRCGCGRRSVRLQRDLAQSIPNARSTFPGIPPNRG
jgi:hypothetical protein